MKVKLIRNKLALIPKDGIRVEKVDPASPVHRAMLVAKLHEEASEVGNAPRDVTEYADVMEVLLQLAHFNGIPERAIFDCMLAKRTELGGFGHGYYMVREW